MKNTRYLLKDFLMHLNENHLVLILQKDNTGKYNKTIHNGSVKKYLNNPYSRDYFIDTIACMFNQFVIYV